jgi:PLP dependent protein
MMPEAEIKILRESLERARRKIAEAAIRAGRNPAEIKLIAVSKTHPADVVRNAVESGVTVFGENKVQEAERKINEIGRETAEWHLIGPLQANKARKAVKLFDLIHTLNSLELAERLERICIEEGRAELAVLIQVDLAGETTKSGVSEKDLPKLVEKFNGFSHLKLRGLMMIPPYFEDVERVRPFFRRLREIRDQLAERGSFTDRKGELSMGMSHDFAAAIEEGATMVRIGTAIFGDRQKPL